MSVTTTANPRTYNLQNTLADYDLHHSSEEPARHEDTLNAHPRSYPQGNGARNPQDWPADHRRVPAYRPVDPELDQSQRRVYPIPAVRAFVGVMFTGVFIEAVGITISLLMRIS